MSPLISRLAIVAAGLPIVLGSAYLGGWFLFALVALGGLIALHEFYRLARPLRPLVLAGYGGALAAFFGAEVSGPAWMLAGFLLTFVLSFVFAAVSETRQSTTVAIAATVFGAAWIGLGLGHLLLVRELDTYGRLALITLLLTVFVTDTFAYVGGRVAGVLTTFVALYKEAVFDDTWRALALGAVIVAAATLGDLFESLVKRDLGTKDTGRLLLGHGGVLDRVDSLLFAAPAAYFTILALAQS